MLGQGFCLVIRVTNVSNLQIMWSMVFQRSRHTDITFVAMYGFLRATMVIGFWGFVPLSGGQGSHSLFDGLQLSTKAM